MNRRNFIRNASLTAAGGVLASALPIYAHADWMHSIHHIVLCVTAGVPQADFSKLFPSQKKNSIFNSALYFPDLAYNGHVAGHRVALESMLCGRYLHENEVGIDSLAQTPLFDFFGPGLHFLDPSYLISGDYSFLKYGQASKKHTNGRRLFVSFGQSHIGDPKNISMFARVKNKAGTATTWETAVKERLRKRQRIDTYSEDLLVAETACTIFEKERPHLLVAHFMGADIAHGNPTQAEENLKNIGQGIQNMWDTVNKNPAMQDRTLFIVLPDFGRNSYPNSMVDALGKKGTDHSINDTETKKIACLLAWNSGLFVGQNKELYKNNIRKAETIDILPTLYWALQQKKPKDLPGTGLLGDWKNW